MRTVPVFLFLFLICFISCGKTPTVIISGPSGTDGLAGKDGLPGPEGSPGPQGLPGANGASPELGPDTPLFAITPCGPNSSPYKEVLLCLYNGSILGSFSDSFSGQNTRFAILPVGSFNDTDSSGCQFNIELESDNKSYRVLWNAGSNAYSIWISGSKLCQAHQ